MDPIEAVADAITKFEGWAPGNKSYQQRNPGNLRDTYGNYRTFQTFVEGYSALLFDLRAKFTGHTKTGLGPDSTVNQLMHVYAPPSDNNPTEAYVAFVCNWVSKALGASVAPETKLSEVWKP